MVLTRAQRSLDLFHARSWPRAYDDLLVHWLNFFTGPLESLESAGLFDLVLTESRRFMVLDLNRYISNLVVKKRVQMLKCDLYAFLLYTEHPGVQLDPTKGKVKVSAAYWNHFQNGQPVSKFMIRHLFRNIVT